jgi:hypothetical protein
MQAYYKHHALFLYHAAQAAAAAAGGVLPSASETSGKSRCGNFKLAIIFLLSKLVTASRSGCRAWKNPCGTIYLYHITKCCYIKK